MYHRVELPPQRPAPAKEHLGEPDGEVRLLGFDEPAGLIARLMAAGDDVPHLAIAEPSPDQVVTAGLEELADAGNERIDDTHGDQAPPTCGCFQRSVHKLPGRTVVARSLAGVGSPPGLAAASDRLSASSGSWPLASKTLASPRLWPRARPKSSAITAESRCSGNSLTSRRAIRSRISRAERR